SGTRRASRGRERATPRRARGTRGPRAVRRPRAVARSGAVPPLTSWGRRRLVRTRQRARGLVRRWRSSLQLRVLASTLTIGVAALAVIGVYVSQSTAGDLFDQRLGQVLD